MTIGEKIRKLRGNIPGRVVADKIGVSYSSYIKYERNERNPSDDVKKKLAKLFGVSVESIFFK